jgi:predicted NBD/HSP70 family sugar kinase
MTVRLTGPPPTPAVGVDIGGSKVLAVAVDETGEVVATHRLPSNGGAAGVVESALEAVDGLAQQLGVPVSSFSVVGVGVPGLVQPLSGEVTHAVNLGVGPDTLSLGARLAEQLGVPVVVENDVNAAALGATQVLGLGHSDLAFLSIGTGLAAGLVTEGRLRRGARAAAGEIGHIPVDPAGPRCSCGQRGCLETLASGSAIAASWPSADGVSPGTALFAAAATGDAAAVAVRDAFAGHVASAVRLLVLTCDIEVVVLGGGVTDLGADLLDAVVAALHRQAAGSPFLTALQLPERVAIVPPGSSVAAIGAALVGIAARDAATPGWVGDAASTPA